MDNNNTKYAGDGYLECSCKGNDIEKIGESFHKAFVGNEDYINSNVVVSVSDEAARIILFDDDIDEKNKASVYVKTAKAVSESGAKEITLTFVGKSEKWINDLYESWSESLKGFNHQISLRPDTVCNETFYNLKAVITTDVIDNADKNGIPTLVECVDYMINSTYIIYLHDDELNNKGE